MADNPYVGGDYEPYWQNGYDAGIGSPGGPPAVPDVLVEEAARTVWSEGALAGYQDGLQHGFEVPLHAGDDEHPEESVVGHVVEVGEIVIDGYSLTKHIWKFASEEEAVEAVGLGIGGGAFLAISVLVLLVALETPPGPPITDETTRALANVATASGRDELFVALCLRATHSGSGDHILAQGYWHGDVATSFTPAWQQAQVHLSEDPNALGAVMVAHFAAHTPDQLELIRSE
jgi:hypothetical protein